VGRLPFLRRCLNRLATPRSEGELGRSALVFAPHQDDETLGCGGTIIRKRELNAAMKIVFMTDGSRSHCHLMEKSRLAEVRAGEAIRSASALGCLEREVRFLGFQDGGLARDEAAALESVTEILEREQPEEVYIPFGKDGPPDHEATHAIVRRALARCQREVFVYEYPIWFWHSWPWVRTTLKARLRGRDILKRVRDAGVFLTAFARFRSSVFVGDVLQRKEAALNCHQSQMTRLNGDPSWPTLHDIAGGDFLDCFRHPFEVFDGYSYSPTSDLRNE
jgi:LmbE family N-acetylglucosaminyl deacetylase